MAPPGRGESIPARARCIALGLACALLCCCGSDDDGGNDAARAGAPTARFVLRGEEVPDFTQVPFPSDAYLANGRIVDPLPGIDAVVTLSSTYLTHELATMNGFSRVGMSFFYVDAGEGGEESAVVDGATLPADEDTCISDASSVFLIDLESTDPARARVRCRAHFGGEQGISRTRPYVAVGPARGIVLEEGHRYAAVLTSRVEDVDARAVAPSASFRAIRDGDRAGRWGALYGEAFDRTKSALAAALASDGAEIVALAPFTTAKMTNELLELHDEIEREPLPVLRWDAASLAPMGAAKFAQRTGGVIPAGFTASLDEWLGVVDASAKLADGSDDPDKMLQVRAHDRIAVIGTAAFESPNYLIDRGDYAVIGHATFARDAAGKIVRAPERPVAKIWVTLALPTSPMPAAGYPLVITQHGNEGSRHDLLELANTFATKGWATAAIDSVTYGARAPEAKFQHDAHTDYERAPGATYAGPDGIADPDETGHRNGSYDLFGGLLNIGALRDQIRQAALDTAMLVRVLRTAPDLGPLASPASSSAPPRIDPERIAYVGNSLGAIEGTVAAAITPGVKAWVLNTTGGELLLEVGTHAPAIASQLRAAAGINFGFFGDVPDEFHPMATLTQTILDPADPISFASRLHTGHDVLQIEVLYDEYVANEANEALARAAGFAMATPNVGTNAGVLDVKDLSKRRGRVPLAEVAPGVDGAIRDTPVPGVTAAMVQVSPATHGYDMVQSRATRGYAIPFARFDTPTPFVELEPSKQFAVTNPYRELQALAVRFFDDAFAGKVPGIVGIPAPVRDLDGDGAPDDRDPDPSNPQTK